MKQVIVIRKDLNMRKGKMVAQGAHASMLFLVKKMAVSLWPDMMLSKRRDIYPAEVNLTAEQKDWLEGKFTKICVSVNSEEELYEIHRAAVDSGLVSHIVIDSGATEFSGVPTATCCAVGPDDEELIDSITGHLPLL